MTVPQQDIDTAKAKKQEIDEWFKQAVATNLDPNSILSLVADRNNRIQREIYEWFQNKRKDEYIHH